MIYLLQRPDENFFNIGKNGKICWRKKTAWQFSDSKKSKQILQALARIHNGTIFEFNLNKQDKIGIRYHRKNIKNAKSKKR